MSEPYFGVHGRLVTVRPYLMEDWEQWYRFRIKIGVSRWLKEFSESVSYDAASRQFGERAGNTNLHPQKPPLRLVVENDKGELVGEVTIRYGSLPGQVMYLSWACHPDHLRRGYMLEAVRLVAADLFKRGYHRLVAMIDPDNNPSKRFAWRVGFIYEGVARDAVRNRTLSWRDQEIWSLLERDWQEPVDG